MSERKFKIMIKDQFKDAIQACNLNFLVGSGLSRPFLPTLGKIEIWLADLAAREDLSPESAALLRASIYKKYFDEVIQKNTAILADEAACHEVRDNYRAFLKAVNSVLLKRKLTLLGKEANLFTTNIDIFLDKSLEDLNLEYNDGFNGRFQPTFSLSNFKKSHFKRSLHFDNTAEIPVFNLLKLHGSLSWTVGSKEVAFSGDLAHIRAIAEIALSPDHILEVTEDATINSLIAASAGKHPDEQTTRFMEAYERLLIVVNPTKEKFKHTLMNQTYYELLRLYSNELEKENTVLFAMGFSFADEHIREITLRAANSNPTLLIYVFAHTADAKIEIEARFGPTSIKNDNIIVLAPEGGADDDAKYDFPTINSLIFSDILEQPEEGADEDVAEAANAEAANAEAVEK
jgi:hypothetical protein